MNTSIRKIIASAHVFSEIFHLVGGNAASVYIALIGHRNGNTGACYISQEKLAEELRVSRKTIAKHLSKLKEKKVIDWIQGDERSSKANQYIFLKEFRNDKEENAKEKNKIATKIIQERSKGKKTEEVEKIELTEEEKERKKLESKKIKERCNAKKTKKAEETEMDIEVEALKNVVSFPIPNIVSAPPAPKMAYVPPAPSEIKNRLSIGDVVRTLPSVGPSMTKPVTPKVTTQDNKSKVTIQDNKSTRTTQDKKSKSTTQDNKSKKILSEDEKKYKEFSNKLKDMRREMIQLHEEGYFMSSSDKDFNAHISKYKEYIEGASKFIKKYGIKIALAKIDAIIWLDTPFLVSARNAKLNVCKAS